MKVTSCRLNPGLGGGGSDCGLVLRTQGSGCGIRTVQGRHLRPGLKGGGGEVGTEWLPTAKWLRNVRAVNSFKGKRKGGACSQFQTKNLIRVLTCKMCLFSLYFVIFITCNAFRKNWSHIL